MSSVVLTVVQSENARHLYMNIAAASFPEICGRDMLFIRLLRLNACTADELDLGVFRM